MSIFHLDYESTSTCDISLGAARYACDPSTRILMFAVARDDEQPYLWRFDEPFSDESRAATTMLREAIDSGSIIYAHNVQFEHFISRYCLKHDTGIEPPTLDQWRCTAAMCRRAAIPYSLAKAAEFLKLGVDKDARGKALIGIFSDQTKVSTLKRGKGTMKSSSPLLQNPVPWDWQVTVAGESLTILEAWELFCEYCRQDVRVEQRLHKTLEKFEITGTELEGFQFDLAMNDRGIPVNVPALKHAKVIVDLQRVALEKEFVALTGLTPTQTAKVLEWLRAEGYPGDNLQAATMEEWDGSDFMTPRGKRALAIRSQLSFAAVKKIPAMLNTACPDDRMRGLFMWYGAMATGRWSSSGPQMQNAKKPTIKDWEEAYDAICMGMDPEVFGFMFGNPYEAVASCIRPFVKPEEGMLIDLDFANIESRVAAALAGQADLLNVYREGRDAYKELASEVFGVPVDQVTKEQRFVGKVGNLSCIAEGELVLTDGGLVPIEKVSCLHRVWDGVEWVRHEGVIYQGTKEVVYYDGVRATEDHEVFVERDGQLRKIQIRDAKRLETRVIRSAFGGKEVRVSDSFDKRSSSCRKIWRILYISSVQLREGISRLLRQPHCGEKSPLQELLHEERGSTLAAKKDQRTASAMRKCDGRKLSQLRRTWDQIQFQLNLRSGEVGYGKSRSEGGSHLGPNRQRWSLRSRESSLGQHVRAITQQAWISVQRKIQPRPLALFSECSSSHAVVRENSSADIRFSKVGCSREEEKLEIHQAKVRVYDIVNAGPRNRFTVNGRLVSNCCFQTGPKTFHETCATWGMPIEKKVACQTVRTFREKYDQFPVTWRKYESAAVKAIKTPGEWVKATEFVAFGYSRAKPFPRLMMRLPSGRCLIYPYAEVKRTIKRHKDYETGESREWESDDLTFMGQLKHAVGFGRISTYAGSLFQSSVQATARDILQHGCVLAEKAGFKIIAVIHDQVLAEEGDPDELGRLLCSHPDWLDKDFPIAVSGGLVKFYAKD